MNPDKETYSGHVEITSTGFTACTPLSLTLFQEQKIQSSPHLGSPSLELLVKPTSWNRALSKEYTTDKFTKWNTGLEFTYTGSDKQSENEMQVEVTEKHGESYRYIPDIANQQLSSCFGSSRSPQ